MLAQASRQTQPVIHTSGADKTKRAGEYSLCKAPRFSAAAVKQQSFTAADVEFSQNFRTDNGSANKRTRFI